ncbi:MAG: Hint domain-containing protein [Pseudomonadota bacterium]
MAIQTIYALGETQISVSGGGELSGQTQGDGSHLQDLFITLNSNAWEAVQIREDDSDTDFDDSDGSQRLDGAQTFDGEGYLDDMRVEAEFGLRLQDSEGNIYEAVAFNINEGGGSSFATVEGLAFVGGVGGFPPIGEPLRVISTQEGPSVAYSALAAPPCFTLGTLIDTPDGPRPVEDLRAGDLVTTIDRGAQPLLWTGCARCPAALLHRDTRFRPVLIRAGAFGPGLPVRDMALSPQHRVLIDDWRAALFFGQPEILAPVCRLVNDTTVTVDQAPRDVTYFHLLFERHELVRAEGLSCESLLATPDATCPTSREVLRLFPQLAEDLPPAAARLCIQGRSARVLLDHVV